MSRAGTSAAGLPADRADEAVQAIQGRAMAGVVRAVPFRDGRAGFESVPRGRLTAKPWLVRRR